MKTVIFDFDGTIADTFAMSIEIAGNLVPRGSLLSKSDLNELKTKATLEIIEELKIPKYRWPFLLFRGRRQMSKRLSEIKLFSGIDKVVEKLRANHFQIYVMSSNSTSNITKLLRINGVKKDFKKIYGGVGLLSKAGALRKVLARNMLNPREVIYVGDEVRDIEAAKDVDIDVIAVTWGYNNVSILEPEQPTKIVKTRKELVEELIIWGNS